MHTFNIILEGPIFMQGRINLNKLKNSNILS